MKEFQLSMLMVWMVICTNTHVLAIHKVVKHRAHHSALVLEADGRGDGPEPEDDGRESSKFQSPVGVHRELCVGGETFRELEVTRDSVSTCSALLPLFHTGLCRWDSARVCTSMSTCTF